MENHYPFTLKPLPYPYDAFVPFLGEDTMHFHHDKHLQTYVDNLNKALEGAPAHQQTGLETLLRELDRLPEALRTPVRNNGGGVYNHELYFDGLSPDAPPAPTGALAAALEAAFGHLDEWKKLMKQAALGQFGSGYAFLVTDKKGTLSIMPLPNQDSPLTLGCYPILCVDVWEHAYYLQHQNRRAAYLDGWLSHINWPFAEARYEGR